MDVCACNSGRGIGQRIGTCTLIPYSTDSKIYFHILTSKIIMCLQIYGILTRIGSIFQWYIKVMVHLYAMYMVYLFSVYMFDLSQNASAFSGTNSLLAATLKFYPKKALYPYFSLKYLLLFPNHQSTERKSQIACIYTSLLLIYIPTYNVTFFAIFVSSFPGKTAELHVPHTAHFSIFRTNSFFFTIRLIFELKENSQTSIRFQILGSGLTQTLTSYLVLGFMTYV